MESARDVLEGLNDWEFIGPHLSIAGMEVDTDAQIMQRLGKAVEEITGGLVIESAQYATDAGVYNSYGIPAVVFGPGDIARAHTEEEYIEIEQLHNAVAIIERMLQ